MRKGRKKQRKSYRLPRMSSGEHNNSISNNNVDHDAARHRQIPTESKIVLPKNTQPQEINRKQHCLSSPPSRLRRYLALIGRWLRRPTSWFAILAGALSVGQASWRYMPRVEITTNINLNSGDLLGLEFQFKNTGILTLHNVVFGCAIYPGPTILESNKPGQESVNYMPSGNVRTRNCSLSVGSFVSDGDLQKLMRLSVVVYSEYSPPLTERRMRNSIRLVPRYSRDRNSVVLVRDDDDAEK